MSLPTLYTKYMKRLCIFCATNKKKEPYGNYCGPKCRDDNLALKRREAVNSAVKYDKLGSQVASNIQPVFKRKKNPWIFRAEK